MATFNSTVVPITAKMVSCVWIADGSFRFDIALSKADGSPAGARKWLVKPDQTCTDMDTGVQVSAAVPLSFINSLGSIATTADTLISTAASAGKITI